jgi:hypothetical protein
MGHSFQPFGPSKGGGGGYLGTDPHTGLANNAVGQLWQGITGKRGPTAPQLPEGFQWLGPLLRQVAGGAVGNIDYGPSSAATAAGQLGSAGGAGLARGIDTGDVSGTFGNALGSLNEGMRTGYLQNLDQLDSLLRPGLNRSFDEGAAALREQAGLTGSLDSSGSAANIRDYRAQLENQLGTNISNLYGAELPASISARSGATALGAGLPGALQQGLYGPLAGQGLEGAQFPLQALGLTTGAVGGAPFYANQGSQGNGAVGAIGSAYAGKGKGKGA